MRNALTALAMVAAAGGDLEAAARGLASGLRAGPDAAGRPRGGRPGGVRGLRAHPGGRDGRARRADRHHRVVAVLGAGGRPRPRQARPMGAAAAPRPPTSWSSPTTTRAREDPAAIRARVLAGARAPRAGVQVVDGGDRRSAIATALGARRARRRRRRARQGPRDAARRSPAWSPRSPTPTWSARPGPRLRRGRGRGVIPLRVSPGRGRPGRRGPARATGVPADLGLTVTARHRRLARRRPGLALRRAPRRAGRRARLRRHGLRRRARSPSSSPTRSTDAPGTQLVVADPLEALGRLARHVVDRGRAAGPAGRRASPARRARPRPRTCSARCSPPPARPSRPAGNLNNELGVPLTVLRVDAETRSWWSRWGPGGSGTSRTSAASPRPTSPWC